MVQEIDLSHIGGYFDRQCHVDEQARAIVLTTDAIDHARRVAAKLRMERIDCSMRVDPSGSRIKLRISGKEDLQRWESLIGFKTDEKRTRLRRILESYEE